VTLATALSAVVDAENAAIYGYSVAGPRLDTAARRTAARSDYEVHRAQLLAVRGWLAQRSEGTDQPKGSDGTEGPDGTGGTAGSDRTDGSGSGSAVAAPPAAVYSLPAPVTDDATAAALLAQLEEATAACYADIVAVAAGVTAATTAPAAATASALAGASVSMTAPPNPGTLQRAAALALQSAAVREARWRGASVPFPGLVDRLPQP